MILNLYKPVVGGRKIREGPAFSDNFLVVDK